MNQRLAFYFFWFILFATLPVACLSAKPQYHLLRLQASDSLAVMVVAPPAITLTRGYDIIDEISLESRDVPVDFRDLEIELADRIARSLSQAAPNLNIVDRMEGHTFIERLTRDPRRVGRAGYALLEPWRPPPPPPKEWTPQWEAEQEKIKQATLTNDAHPSFWLLAVDRPWGNGTRRTYLTLNIEGIRKRALAKYLLFVGIDAVHAVNRSHGLNVTVTIRTRLLSLTNGTMPVEFIQVEPMMRDGVLEDDLLLQDNGKLVQNALLEMIPRYVTGLVDQMNGLTEK